ncbi:hypothetical protein EVAR_5043_1 [Eumeta japonica]|uniref:Uncharacterized protein n=1 Tax=Eumeta variegata TaxID=151549 RepID=A0A4C1SWR3_EUMVA|nr:hypothetical protein EVAR_5043_1 [Eumeta japonica]
MLVVRIPLEDSEAKKERYAFSSISIYVFVIESNFYRLNVEVRKFYQYLRHDPTANLSPGPYPHPARDRNSGLGCEWRKGTTKALKYVALAAIDYEIEYALAPSFSSPRCSSVDLDLEASTLFGYESGPTTINAGVTCALGTCSRNVFSGARSE